MVRLHHRKPIPVAYELVPPEDVRFRSACVQSNECVFRAVVRYLSTSIWRWMNVRPGLITMLASCRRPTKDCRLRFVLTFRWAQDLKLSCRRASFSAGKCNSRRCVSNSISRKVRQVVGPSSFGRDRGRLRILHVSISSCQLHWHSLLNGLPVIMKSSRKWSRLVTLCSKPIHSQQKTKG